MNLRELTNRIIDGYLITKEDAITLISAPLEELCSLADEIRKAFCGNSFDLCTIINAKSGRCSEDCKYCAQSSFYDTHVETYPLLSAEQIAGEAAYNYEQGVLRFSIVTSGKRLSPSDVTAACEAIHKIKDTSGIKVCVSMGLLDEESFRQLKEAGASRVHNNLETSKSQFPKVCTTHSFDEKVSAIKAAQAAGLTVCSGGIMGLGESMEDRIDMAFSLRELGIHSVPVNMLNPIPCTPYEHLSRLTLPEMRRIIAIYRFILPDASIRLAGGRGLMPDKGKSCFQSGANAAISGDMLTTAGISIKTDLELLNELGYEVK